MRARFSPDHVNFAKSKFKHISIRREDISVTMYGPVHQESSKNLGYYVRCKAVFPQYSMIQGIDTP